MKKTSIIAFLALALTISFFVLYPRLIEIIVRIQRSENPSSISVNDLMEDVESEWIASTVFDDQTINFYYNIGQLENEGYFYGSLDQRIKDYPQNMIENSTHTHKFYVNFFNKYIIQENGIEIEPNEVIAINTEKHTLDIPIYYLDKSKTITMKERSIQEDITFGCSYPSLCAKTETIDLDTLGKMQSTWKEVESPDFTYNEYQQLFVLHENWNTYDPLSGHITHRSTSYHYVQDKNGSHYLMISENRSSYYQLTDNQIEELFDFIKSPSES